MYIHNYFECECGSPEHTLVFRYNEEDNELYTMVFLNQYRNIFKRIWVAIKYIFGYKSKYGDWDCFVLRPEDKDRLIRLIGHLNT